MRRLRPTNNVVLRGDSTKAAMSFQQLLHHLDPNPEFLPSPWKKAFDRRTKTALIYQLDLLSSVPRIKKAVRVNCKEASGGFVLVPSVFINDQPLEPTFVKDVTGNEHVTNLEDLSLLLEQVDQENHQEHNSACRDHLHSSTKPVQHFGYDYKSGLPASESNDNESLQEDFPLYNSEFDFELEETNSPQLFDDETAEESEQEDDQESEVERAGDTVVNPSKRNSDTALGESKAKKQKLASPSSNVKITAPARQSISTRAFSDPTSDDEIDGHEIAKRTLILRENPYIRKIRFGMGQERHLKNPSVADPAACKLFDDRSDWYFQVPGHGKMRLHDSWDVYVDTEFEILKDQLKNPKFSQGRYIWLLMQRLIGGDGGLRRCCSLYELRRFNEAGNKRMYGVFERMLGDMFFAAISAHILELAREKLVPEKCTALSRLPTAFYEGIMAWKRDQERYPGHQPKEP